MTQHRRLVLPTLLAIVLSVPALRAGAAERWEPLPLYGGDVEVTAAPSRPSIVYAATPAAGLFRSIDSGESWHFVAYGPGRKRMRILSVDPRNPNRLYAALLPDGFNPFGVYRSDDGGRRWRLSRGLPAETTAITFDRRDPARIYAATSNGLFLSHDGGDTWAQLALPNVSLLAVALPPSHPGVVLVSNYTSESRQIQRSEDGGRTFVPVAEESVDGFVFDPTRPGRVYGYGFSILTIVRSDDMGMTWTRLEANNLLQTLAITPAGVLLAGTYGSGVIRSLDGGESWSPKPSRDSRPVDDVNSLAVLRNRVLAGGSRGIWRGTIEGREWRAASDGLQAQSVGVLAVAPDADSSLYVGVWRSLFITRNTGATFHTSTKSGLSLYLQHLVIHPRQTQTAYAWGCCTPNGSGVLRTDDGGLHWRALPYTGVSRDFQVLAVDPVDPDIVYAGGSFEPHSSPCTALRSLDGGETWSCMRPSGIYDFTDLAFDPRDSRVLYGLFGSAKQLYRSTDRGVHWSLVPANDVAKDVWQIEIDPMEPNRLYGTGGYNGVFRSDDGGRTWKHKGPGGASLAVVHDFLVDPSRPGRIYVALEVFRKGDPVGTGQVFRSDDAGDHWEALSDGLPGSVVLELAADPRGADVLYAGTAGQGLYRLHVED